jgi:hypothetical protein
MATRELSETSERIAREFARHGAIALTFELLVPDSDNSAYLYSIYLLGKPANTMPSAIATGWKRNGSS